jgi:ligand-binding sensor domain-containing protein/two-component sensor histidine kinase
MKPLECRIVGKMRHFRVPSAIVCLFQVLIAVAYCLPPSSHDAPKEATPRVREAHLDPKTIWLPVIDHTDIRFSRLSTENGLSQTLVSQIIQDNQGFMWFGTQYGLDRFDGYSFTVFKHEQGVESSLSGVFISSLFKDRSGTIWVGCNTFLDRFDPITETFTHYPIDSRFGGTAPVENISQDDAGALWLSTSEGLFRFNPTTGKIIHFRHDPDEPSSLSSDAIKSTGEDGSGDFWVATSEGLDKFDRARGKVTLHIPLHERGEMTFHEDHTGVFWIAHVSGTGLAVFDEKHNRITQYSFRREHVSGDFPTGISSMLEDHDGNMWFATIGDGLLKLDSTRREFIRYRNVAGDPESLPQDSLRQLYEDKEGNIWIGTFIMALSRFADRPPLFQAFRNEPGNINSPRDTFVDAIYEDREGSLWIGGMRALNRLDVSTGKYTFYSNPVNGVNIDANSIAEDRSGDLWVGTAGHGLLKLNRQTGTFTRFVHRSGDPSSLSSDLITRVLVDKSNRIWITSFDGLNLFDPATSRFSVFRHDRRAAQIYLDVTEDHNGDLWIGTHASGLLLFHPQSRTFVAFGHDPTNPSTLSDNRVNSVLFDHSGTMWVGTQNGLDRFNRQAKTFTNYYDQNGLAGDAVSCILEDKSDRLWMGTNNGLSSLNLASGNFRNFSTADGLPGMDLTGWGACSKSVDGEMFFGGFSGGIAFNPDKLQDDKFIPPVVLTGFDLFGRPVLIGRDSPLKASIGYTRSLTLTYNMNIISFEFSGLSYASASTNRYRYKLDNLDSEWHEVSSTQRMVTYTTLPAGRYVFRVQSATSRGDWSRPGVELALHILPPWWNTWWFRVLSAATVLVAFWFLHWYRVHEMALQFNARFEERVHERLRIARDLHDTLLQSIHGLMLRFHFASETLKENDPARPMLREALERADTLIIEGRNRVHALRNEGNEAKPLSEKLADAVSGLAQGENKGIQIVENGVPQQLRPAIQEEFYWICREALVNSVKHSEASRIEVDIIYERRVFKLRCRDNGKGVPEDVLKKGTVLGHFGIPGMNERAKSIGATFRMWSSPGKGTEVEVSVGSTTAYVRQSIIQRCIQHVRTRSANSA